MDQRFSHPPVAGALPRLIGRGLAAWAALALAGCVAVYPYSQAPMSDHLQRRDEVGDCARRLEASDIVITAAGTRDAGAPRLAGFPYLRVDRFRADLGRDLETPAEWGAWIGWMARLDAAARTGEGAQAGLSPLAMEAIDRCRAMLARADSAEHQRLRQAAQVPDDYSLLARSLGLYPLVRIPFAAGVRRWQDETRIAFAAAAPSPGSRVEWSPPPASASALGPVARDRLDVPVLSAAQTEALLARHAPVFSIEAASAADRIGRVGWAADGLPQVDPAWPAVYTRIAYTRVAGRPALQLVYTAWMSERPAVGWGDILAGRLDGLVWRVTLDEDGAALAYDSIHPCGCYHVFIPTERVRARPQPESLDETLFAPQTLDSPRSDQQVVLRLAAGSHYLQGVDLRPRLAPAETYALLDEAELTRLPRPGGGRLSLYGEDGLVAGTERGERWWFWPMGISSAGQMRQWGRHATAFVGRRHFDDPGLFDLYFERQPLAPPAAPALQ